MHLLYITTNFHGLTLTFVTREVDQLRKLGLQVSLLSLRRQGQGGSVQPECDLKGCLYLHPVDLLVLIKACLSILFQHPLRFMKALRLALTSPGDSWTTRLKMVGQLLASTTVLARIQNAGITHLHAHLANPPGNYALFLSILSGLPFSFTGHAADLYRQPEALRIKLRHCALAIAISKFNQDLYRRVQPDFDRAPLVHCGIRLEDFPFKLRTSPGIPLNVLAVGRATEKKGFTHLLDALAIVNRRGLPWQGHLVGEGPQLATLRDQARDLGLDQLAIVGALQQSQIRELIGAADVFVLPCIEAADGDIDGIPVALMEAMASGCPVISTRLSGIPELVIHGVTGLLAEPGDARGLADLLQRIAEDPDLLGELSRQGRDHVADHFNLAIETAKLASLFQDLHALDRSRTQRQTVNIAP